MGENISTLGGIYVIIMTNLITINEKESLLKKAVVWYRRRKIVELVEKGINNKADLGLELKKLKVYFNKKFEIENPNKDRKKNTGKLHHDIKVLVDAKILRVLNLNVKGNEEFLYGLDINANAFLGKAVTTP